MKHLFPTVNSGTPNDECYTPPYIFEALGLTFDLDVASPEKTTFVPALRRYSKQHDGLVMPWEGLVWMNPPYSKPLPWVERFIDHANGIALVPSSQGKWMKMLWESDAAWMMLGKTRFIYGSTMTEAKTDFPSRLYLIGMGSQAIEALHQSGLGKVR